MARRGQRSTRQSGSGRALALGIVLFLVAITLAPPTQRYFAQRAQIGALNAQVTANTQALAEAARELQLWRDPAYIKSQARERLHFILPGERSYIVTDPTNPTATQPTTAVSNNLPNGLPWYNRLISSITEVGMK
jgi:cell division protein FtsB